MENPRQVKILNNKRIDNFRTARKKWEKSRKGKKTNI